MLPEYAMEIALRLSVAVLIGGAIGLNRQLRHKPAGMRTHALVALGAAAVILLEANLDGTMEVDAGAVSRVIQGVLTGIGFLGAGVILRSANGKNVHGLTTAGSVWLAACLGIACGIGAWFVTAIACFWVFAILIGGGPIERWIMVKSRTRPEDVEP